MEQTVSIIPEGGNFGAHPRQPGNTEPCHYFRLVIFACLVLCSHTFREGTVVKCSGV